VASTAAGLDVYNLLKVLGTTDNEDRWALSTVGEKVGGYPVDKRWTTVGIAVDSQRPVDQCTGYPVVFHTVYTGRHAS